MLSRIWSASASTRTLQSFRFFSVSCYKTQANSTQHQNAPPKSFYQKLKEYPELRKMLIDAKGNTHKEFWAKLRAEPELLRAKQEEARRLNRRLIETNADARAKKIATATAYFHAHSQDEAFLRCRAISRWCFGLPDRSKSAWVREILPWKTHLPTRYHQEAYRFYSCCGTQRYLKTAVST
jgi:hypothetical protein